MESPTLKSSRERITFFWVLVFPVIFIEETTSEAEEFSTCPKPCDDIRKSERQKMLINNPEK
jgi:hypothetical protein